MTKTTTVVVPGWLRSTLAFVLIFLAAVLTPLSVTSSWLKTQVTDTNQFVEMTTTALHNPAVEQVISDEVSALIIKELNVDQLTADLFAGLKSVLPLGDTAANALSLLEQPLASGAKSLIERVTENVITSEAFENVTEQALTLTHTQVMDLLRGNPDGAIVADERGVIGIQVGPIVEAVKEELVAQGIGLAERIPTINATVEIGQVEGIVQARMALNALDALGYWLPIVVLIMLVLGVLAARQRARAAVWAGIGVILSTGAALVAVSLGKYAFLVAVTPQLLPGTAANVIYSTFTARLTELLVAALFIGVLVLLTAYLVGPFRGAQVVRAGVTDTAGRLRGIAEERGVSTGSFGRFVDMAHGWIIGVVLAATALTLFLLRPFSVAGGIWAAIIALLLVLIVELVRRPAEAVTGVAAPAASAPTAVAPAMPVASAAPTAPTPAAPAAPKKPAAKKPAAKKPATKKPAAKKPAAKKAPAKKPAAKKPAPKKPSSGQD